MYSTCLFCHASLGANEVIEHFPVGRRLAFDAAKGRLWVVCKRCLRWNLTPLEERWEAIEECERIFRATKLRVSTDNIGMARVREGLELVRIGEALRPEIAVWRYASVNQSRRRRAVAIGAASGAAAVGAFFAGPAAGIGVGYFSWQLGRLAYQSLGALLKGRYRRIPLATRDGMIRLTHEQARRTRLVTAEGRDWRLRIPHDGGVTDVGSEGALRSLGVLLAAVNDDGVDRKNVLLGERILTDAGDTPTLLWRLARADRPFLPLTRRRRDGWILGNDPDDTLGLAAMGEGHRVALEMAVNEENERRAMEGELAALEAAWKEAEEVAAIADDLFLGRDVNRRFEAMKRGREPGD